MHNDHNYEPHEVIARVFSWQSPTVRKPYSIDVNFHNKVIHQTLMNKHFGFPLGRKHLGFSEGQ